MRRRLHVKSMKHLWKSQGVKLLNKLRESKGQWDWGEGLTSGLERLGMRGFLVTEQSLEFILSTVERRFNWEVTWQNFVLFFFFKYEKICLRCRSSGFDLWVRKILWRREWQSTPVFLPGEFHEQRSLASYIQFIGSQRVGHNWATNKQNKKTYIYIYIFF